MTLPPWVTGVDEYVQWIQRVLAQSGGILEPHYYDKHEDHHGVGLCHVHRARGRRREKVLPAPEMDLADVIELMHDEFLS